MVICSLREFLIFSPKCRKVSLIKFKKTFFVFLSTERNTCGSLKGNEKCCVEFSETFASVYFH